MKNSNNNLLELKNVSKKYGKKTVVDKFSFELSKGEIIGLIGPNGAGKTTLMRIIVGLIKKYEGEIVIHGKNAKDKTNKKIIGSIIENPQFYNNLSGLDNLIYFSSFYKKADIEHILSIVEKLGLKNDINKKVKTYSMGMRQRLGLILSIIDNPDILILDEPINGLDPSGVHEIRNFLVEITKTYNTSILISSHILSEIEKICNRVMFMKDGILLEEIKHVASNNMNLEEKYLKLMGVK